jgi:hypothetical protein
MCNIHLPLLSPSLKRHTSPWTASWCKYLATYTASCPTNQYVSVTYCHKSHKTHAEFFHRTVSVLSSLTVFLGQNVKFIGDSRRINCLADPDLRTFDRDRRLCAAMR